MKSPCSDCERKGCGAYHDECEKFHTWKAQQNERLKKDHRPKYRAWIPDSTYNSRKSMAIKRVRKKFRGE